MHRSSTNQLLLPFHDTRQVAFKGLFRSYLIPQPPRKFLKTSWPMNARNASGRGSYNGPMFAFRTSFRHLSISFSSNARSLMVVVDMVGATAFRSPSKVKVTRSNCCVEAISVLRQASRLLSGTCGSVYAPTGRFLFRFYLALRLHRLNPNRGDCRAPWPHRQLAAGVDRRHGDEGDGSKAAATDTAERRLSAP